jgi:hypothetical protein
VATESKAAYDDDDNARVERVAKPIAMAKPISRIARHFGNNRCNEKQIGTETSRFAAPTGQGDEYTPSSFIWFSDSRFGL